MPEDMEKAAQRIRDGYEAFNRGDFDAAAENLHPDVVLDTTFHAKGAGSGIELNQDGYHLWRIKDGKGAEFRFFLDRDEAVAAAGSPT